MLFLNHEYLISYYTAHHGCIFPSYYSLCHVFHWIRHRLHEFWNHEFFYACKYFVTQIMLFLSMPFFLCVLFLIMGICVYFSTKQSNMFWYERLGKSSKWPVCFAITPISTPIKRPAAWETGDSRHYRGPVEDSLETPRTSRQCRTEESE